MYANERRHTKPSDLNPAWRSCVGQAKQAQLADPSFQSKTLHHPAEERLHGNAFILKMAELKQVDGNTLQIAVRFSFHKDKLMEKKCKDSLEKALSEVMETKVKLDCIVEQSEQKQKKEDLQNLASSFGGEVIS